MENNYYILYILALLFLSGCASSDERDSDAGSYPPDLDYRGSDCILIRTVRDYTPLDRQHLLIHGAGNRAYFVRLIRPAFELRSSIGLRVESRDDQLCPFGGDRLIFGAFADERVGVQSISRLTADQEEHLLIQYGKMPPESQAPADAPEVKGAEVEELG